MDALCAWCNSPKHKGPICPDCGADYAKAEAIKTKGKAESAHNRSTVFSDSIGIIEREKQIPVKDPAFEKKVCLFALPAMLGFALLVQITGFLSGMQRIVFAMPVHELGHAASGWLCGFNSVPTLWKTITPVDRGYISSLLLIIGLTLVVRYNVKTKNFPWLIAVVGVLALQIYGTLIISPGKADMFITLGGDALGLILATLLMALFYLGKDTQLYKGALRWGFLGIGAAAFFNMYMPWWNKDITAIGYGLTGGIPTDSWKMINIHLWQWNDLFAVHITIGIVCLFSLLIVYTLGLVQAIGWVKIKKKQERLHRLRNS